MALDPVLVEKLAAARHGKSQLNMMLWESMDRRYREAKVDVMRECAQLVFDELGLKEEHREPPAGTSTRIHGQIRYVSDWISVDQLGRPVEQGDAQ